MIFQLVEDLTSVQDGLEGTTWIAETETEVVAVFVTGRTAGEGGSGDLEEF